MILTYNSNVGIMPLLDYVEQTPQLTGFNKITFGGTSGMTISNIWGQELVNVNNEWENVTEEYLDTYNPMSATWTQYTYLLADFNNGLEGGIVQDIGQVEAWALYRWDNKSNEALLLKNFDGEATKYIDYTALLNTNYKYLLYAYGESGMSPAFQTSVISLNYYGYFLIDVDDDVVYKFDTNLSGGDLQQNMDYSSFRTNNKYETYNVGDLQYLSGNISALVRYANSDNFINNSVGLLENLRDFVKSGQKIKILKTRKGEGWYVFTYDYKDAVINQAIGAQPVNASFSFNVIGTFKEGVNNQSLQTIY